MRSFTPPAGTRFYAGVDLHARALFLVILDRDGKIVFARNMPAAPEPVMQEGRRCCSGRQRRRFRSPCCALKAAHLLGVVEDVPCPFPRCDRISGSMLPNCHPIGRCLLHREFGNASSRENNPAPEILPRTPPEAGSSRTPPLPRLFAAPLESRFSQRHGPLGRGVLPRRGGMARRCRAAQTDALPALQGCRHADSARVSIRV